MNVYTPRPAANCQRGVEVGDGIHHEWKLTESNMAEAGEPIRYAEFYECRRCGAMELLT